MNDRVMVRVDGRELELSNLDKVLYPEAGFTKGEVIDYYVRVAPVILPHLRDRPLTRVRYPNGVTAASFFEKNAPAERTFIVAPNWDEPLSAQRRICEYVNDGRPLNP